MLKIIAIDDEYSTLKLLPLIINWEDYGFELTKTFSNVQQALDFICTNEVDAVISDICMPGMTGIDFVKEMNSSFPDILIVFLSAYKDFEYAQTAVKYGVFDYITKPIDFDDIEDLLIRLKKALIVKKQFKNNYSMYAKQQLIIDYMEHKINEEDIKNSLFGENGPDINRLPAAVLNIIIDNPIEFLKTKWSYGIDRLYSCLIGFIENTLIDVIPVSLSDKKAEILIFSKAITDKTDFSKTIEKMQTEFSKNCSENLELSANIEVINIFSCLSEAEALLYAMGFLSMEPKPPKKDSNNAMEKVIEYIDKNISSDISLSDAAGSVYMSPYHFSRLFKAYHHENFSDFVLKKRLEYAQTLIKSGKYTISQIAEMSGFLNRSYFHRVFKHNVGCTPKEYMQKESENPMKG